MAHPITSSDGPDSSSFLSGFPLNLNSTGTSNESFHNVLPISFKPVDVHQTTFNFSNTTPITTTSTQASNVNINQIQFNPVSIPNQPVTGFQPTQVKVIQPPGQPIIQSITQPISHVSRKTFNFGTIPGVFSSGNTGPNKQLKSNLTIDQTTITQKEVKLPGRRDPKLPLEDDLDSKELLVGTEVERDMNIAGSTQYREYNQIYNLSDLAYSYPSLNDPQFQSKLSSKLEFLVLKNDGKEPLPDRGGFFTHQTFIHRYLQVFDRALLIYPTGSGKTCSAGGAAEEFRRNFLKGVISYAEQYLSGTRNQIKHVHIIVPGKIVRDEFKNQIICKCSQPGDYDIEYISGGGKQRAITGRVNKVLKSFYTIYTRGSFWKAVKDLTNKEIEEKYSGSLFIIDEAHTLGLELKDYRAIPKITRDDKVEIKEKILIYRQIYRVFDVIKRSKVIAMTATPMINTAIDFNSIMNLLLPRGMKLPIENLTNWSVDRLKPYIQGRVSYVPDIDIDIILIEEGKPLNYYNKQLTPSGKPYKTKIYVGTMLNNRSGSGQQYQGDVYDKIAYDRINFRNILWQASNFIFPDGSYGEKGYNKYMKSSNNRDILRRSMVYNENPNLNLLARRSIKYSQIIPLIREHRKRPGKYYCFENIVKGSGIEMLAEALSVNGWAEYNGSISAISGQNRNYCQHGDKDSDKIVNRIKPGFPKIPRFAIITGNVNDEPRRRILRLFNSIENINGEYIEVILMSSAAQLGLSLNNTTAISIIDAYWNEAVTYQSISRAIRVVGFNDLLRVKRSPIIANNKRLREEAIISGINPDNIQYSDPNQVKIEVRIYRHVAISANGESSDFELYRDSEKKAIEIEKLMHKIKGLSIDCSTHFLRSKKHVQTARIKHISDPYICNDTHTQPIDPNGFNAMYAEPNVQRAVNFLREVFKTNSSYRLEYLFDDYLKLGRDILSHSDKIKLKLLEYLYSPKFILRAVRHLMMHRIELNDRFGFARYLYNDGNLLFLIDRYPLPGTKFTPLSAHYVDVLNGIPINNISTYVEQIQRPNQLSIIEQIKTAANPNLVPKLVKTLNAEGKAELLEWAILNKNHPMFETIIQLFEYHIHQTDYPEGLIKRIQERLVKPGAGRPLNDPSNVNIQFKNELADPKNYDPTRRVVLHNVYGTGISDTQYQRNADFYRVKGKIRVLMDLKWADPGKIEEKVYRQIMEYKLKGRLQSKGRLYGRRDGDKFRVINALAVRRGETDSRRKAKGRICKTFKVAELVEFLVHSGASLPIATGSLPTDSVIEAALRAKMDQNAIDRFGEVTEFINNEEIVTGRNNNLKLTRMRQAYQWHQYISSQKIPRTKLCEILETRMSMEDVQRIVIN